MDVFQRLSTHQELRQHDFRDEEDEDDEEDDDEDDDDEDDDADDEDRERRPPSGLKSGCRFLFR